MRIRTRLWLGFAVVLSPILILVLSSGISFRHLSQSNASVSQALLRYQDAMVEYQKLTHLNDLTNRLLRNFLKLGYVTEMAEVHPLQVRVREDLDELMRELEVQGISDQLKEVSSELRASVDELVVEKSKEITTLEYLQEVQSTKISGVNDGLERLEDRFSAQMRVRPRKVRALSVELERKLDQNSWEGKSLSSVFRGLTIHEMEQLWELPPLVTKNHSLEVGKLKLLARDVLLKSKSQSEMRAQLLEFLKPKVAQNWGQDRTERLEWLYQASTVAYAERIERLMVVSKNLNFMRSMINQGTRMVSELQATITQSRSRSFKTITNQLIPETQKVEEVIIPKLRKWETTVTQRLAEAQALSQRSANELSKFFSYALVLIGFCLVVGILVTVFVTRAVSRPVQALVKAAKRISHGNFETGVSLSGDGEFKLLADTFNEMSHRVKDSVSGLEHRLSVNTAIAKAITQTTQMLAHDVRKPFTMLKLGLNTLKLIENRPDEMKSLVAQLSAEVKRALQSVDHLISDVMEIGGDSPLKLSDESPVSLVSSALNDVFRYAEESQIEFFYEWKHSHLTCVDSLKMRRVMMNILDNARQALSGQGKIWFKTKEVMHQERAFVEMCIGNSGPLISSENHERIFEVFFTSGKQSGTGLGLAIAKKIVTAHEGGMIWVTSDAETGTQFWCRLPMSPLLEGELPDLARHSRELSLEETTKPHTETLPLEATEVAASSTLPTMSQGNLRKKISEKLRSRGSSLVMMIVEDEVFYADALIAMIDKDKTISDEVHVLRARNSAEALQLSETHPFDLIICDLDLGEDSLNGFELVRQFRALANRAHICIHSNRSLASDYRDAAAAGADAFLPKPMGQTHLLQLVLAALERAEIEKQNIVAARSVPEEVSVSRSVQDEISEFEVQELGKIDRSTDRPEPTLN